MIEGNVALHTKSSFVRKAAIKANIVPIFMSAQVLVNDLDVFHGLGVWFARTFIHWTNMRLHCFLVVDWQVADKAHVVQVRPPDVILHIRFIWRNVITFFTLNGDMHCPNVLLQRRIALRKVSTIST